MNFNTKNDALVLRYLDRINLKGPIKPNAESLAKLQSAHLCSIPYENLDIFTKRHCSLAYNEIFDKVICKKRGGYCFELNGLFGWLLRTLGYKTEEFFGRWLMGEPVPYPKRRHRVIKVQTEEGIFIADVGLGRRAPLTPLRFVNDIPQQREGVNYRIIDDPILVHVVQAETPDGYVNMFSFDDAPQLNIDFEYPHFYCTTHPQSPFLQKIMVHLPTANGRNSVASAVDPETGLIFPLFSINQTNDKTQKFFVRNDIDFHEALAEFFDIHINFPVIQQG